MTDCKCPHCLKEIPAGTQAEIVAAHTRYRLQPCQGPGKDGAAICGTLLTARQRNRPCPTCGHTGWKDGAARKDEDGSVNPDR